MADEVILQLDKETGTWEERKEPFAVIECETEADFERLKAALDFHQKHQWISVEDRLPEVGQLVLCYCVCSYEVLRFMNENSWLGARNADYMKGYVTHWMPLPGEP